MAILYDIQTGEYRGAGKLRVLSPLQTLERGYAIVRTDSRVVKDASALAVGTAVDVRVATGSFGARVEEVHGE